MSIAIFVVIALAIFFVVFRIIPIGILVLLPALLFWVSRKAAKGARAKIKKPIIGAILGASIFFVIFGIPSIWTVSSFAQLEYACHSPPSVRILMQAPPQEGFLANDDDAIDSLAGQKFISYSELIDRQEFSFIESPVLSAEYARRNNIPMEYRRQYKNHTEKTKEPVSKFSFDTDVVKVGKFGAPLYNVHHRIRSLPDGALVAEATDVVFGGGLLGAYLALFRGSGGQDDSEVSCGYASKEIESWRPNDVSNKRYAQYIEADVKFVVSAIGKKPVLPSGTDGNKP